MPRVPSPSLPHVLVGSLLLLVLVMAQAAHPPSTAAATCTRHVNVDRSGRTDVTAELQRFINNSRNGAKICFARNGQYKVNGGLRLIGRHDLVLRGRGATLFQSSRSRERIVQIDGGTRLSLLNLTIRGANPRPGVWSATYEHNHAIQVRGATHVHINNVRIRNVGGDGLYLAGGESGGRFRWAAAVRMHDSVVKGTGRSGLSITDGAKDVSVDHTAFRRIAFYTFNIEPNGIVRNGSALGARDVRIVRNRLSRQPFGTGRNGQPDGYAFVVTGSSGGGPADDILVKRNRIAGKQFRVGVFDNGGLRRNIRVVGNRSDKRVSGPVMFFGGVRTLVVTNNRQPLSSGKLVSTANCSNIQISGNVIR